MKELTIEYAENIHTGDATKRAPELEPWNSFSRPKVECDLRTRSSKMIKRSNSQLEALKI